MKYKSKLLYFFITYFIFSLCGLLNVSASYSRGLININLDNELKKGNLLIGLKQFLGGEKSHNNDSKNLIFKSDNSLMNIQSSNGINYKSKEFKIIWEKVPLTEPILVERYVMGPFSSFESAKKQANILQQKGYDITITYPNNWQIWLNNEIDLSLNNQFNLQKEIIKNKVVPILVDEYNQYRLDGPILITSDKSISINNINYGKNFYISKDSYGTWTLIQKISFDKYLEGVLPHEIGSNSPIEALKAQAVIARSWAIYNSDRFNADKFHLCITTQCQVYKPNENSYENIQKAIEETSNLILTFENRPINAFYHASNGGVSASSSESWQMEEYPYLESNFDMLNLSDINFRLPFKNESEIKYFIENDQINLIGKEHYLFRWERKLSSREIEKYLIRSKLLDKDEKIIDLKVLDRGKSGRVTKLELIKSNSTLSIVLVKDDIRRYLNFLPSNLFIINKLNDNFWSFQGGGFGHGVGLSQSGAIEMAKLGFNYREILNHYYPGAELLNIKNLK